MNALFTVALGVSIVALAVLFVMSNRYGRAAIVAGLVIVGLAFALFVAYGTGVLSGL